MAENKVALLFGLNYVACPDKLKLRGCHNDIDTMVNYLTQIRGYAKKNIMAHVDFDLRTTSQPGIIESLYDLVSRSYKEDLEEVFIHYSGHGAEVNQDNDELYEDKDQVLVPWDYVHNGYIRDDKLHKILYKMNPKTRVICIFDCCHSGTMADLPYKYVYNVEKNDIEEELYVENEDKEVKEKPFIITISGCKDKQVSMDAYNVNNKKRFSGAMTSCFMKSMRNYVKQTGKENKIDVQKLVQKIYHTLRENDFTQTPVLCSSIPLSKETFF